MKPPGNLALPRPPFPIELNKPDLNDFENIIDWSREDSRRSWAREDYLMQPFTDIKYVRILVKHFKSLYGDDWKVSVYQPKIDKCIGQYWISLDLKGIHIDTHISGHYEITCQASYEQFMRSIEEKPFWWRVHQKCGFIMNAVLGA